MNELIIRKDKSNSKDGSEYEFKIIIDNDNIIYQDKIKIVLNNKEIDNLIELLQGLREV